jgi:hypothetical protein
MLTRTCDRCGVIIPDDDKTKGSVYQPLLTRDSTCYYEGEKYLRLKEVDLCYKCAFELKKVIEKWVSKKA